VLVAVVALVSTAVVGCTDGSSGEKPSKSIEVGIDDVLKKSAVGQDVTLSVGDTLKVTLGSNHTTPYRWNADAKIADTTVLQQTSHRYVQSDSSLVGAPGLEVWTFKAQKPGVTSIVTDYASIVGDPAPVCTFTSRVTVR
jgi:inhibitor of cysteine peptidase